MYKIQRTFIVLLIFLGLSFNLEAQESPFEIHIEPISIEGLGGLQSYAYAQHNGKWLILGGRVDGLHRRQPFAAFDIAGHHTNILVVDPVENKVWTSSISTLSATIQEQVKSTNMQFYQSKDKLYLTGGYGRSEIINDHTTFPYLTVVSVSGLIETVINQQSITPYFRQVQDSKLQVTGGHLKKIDEVFYLVGGNKFLGRYNPQGPDFGPGFIQEYTNQVRRFTIDDDGTNITINHLTPFTDSAELHRRDYNVVPQIFPNGEMGITAFSGVFQKTANLPFLNAVDIDANGHRPILDFSQYYNHYHCAYLATYSENDNEMHHIFFGGIAQYYDSAGILVQDNNVPFVKTIARVTRNADGKMAEYKLPIEMPSLLGAGSELIINQTLTTYPNGVIKLDELSSDSNFIGYIFGGISSTAPNIFFTNTGTQSAASHQVFKVYLIKEKTISIDKINLQSIGSLNLVVMPNPTRGDFKVRFYLENSSDVSITIYNLQGKKIQQLEYKNMPQGFNEVEQYIKKIAKSGTYLLKVETALESDFRRVILR